MKQSMIFKQATTNDVKQVVAIYEQAIAYFKANNIDQWQDNYPNEASLIDDINEGISFVMHAQNRVVGTIALILGGEVDYDIINDGAWLSDGKYLTIHRIAVDSHVKGAGIAQGMMANAINYARMHQCQSLRIDTHQDNLAMRRFLEKEGFKHCGIVYINNKLRRYAYEKLLNEQS